MNKYHLRKVKKYNSFKQVQLLKFNLADKRKRKHPVLLWCQIKFDYLEISSVGKN